MSGQVSLGLASGSTAAQLALPLLQSLRDQQPGILLSLHENSGAALAGQVANQTLDMAMVYGAKMPAGLHAIALMREDLYLVATRAVPHPGNSVELLDVARLNLFLPREGDAVRNQLEEAMALRKLAINVVGRSNPRRAERRNRRRAGATVLPESVARAMIGPAKAWMARINAPTMSAAGAVHVGPTGAVRPGSAGQRHAAVDRRRPQPGETRAGAGALRIKLLVNCLIGNFIPPECVVCSFNRQLVMCVRANSRISAIGKVFLTV